MVNFSKTNLKCVGPPLAGQPNDEGLATRSCDVDFAPRKACFPLTLYLGDDIINFKEVVDIGNGFTKRLEHKKSRKVRDWF